MANLNNVQIIGRLGKEPEMRYTSGGTACCKFSVAVEAYVPKDSDKPKHTEWFNVVAWTKLAEVCAKYLSKGDLVYCQGEMQTREYNKDGQRRYFSEINMRQMQMLKTKGKAGQDQPASKPPEQSQVPDFDDDIPF
jgi:single-strand DNA-binding protein